MHVIENIGILIYDCVIPTMQTRSSRKTDYTDLWVIKLTNQVLPSIGFRVPHSHKHF